MSRRKYIKQTPAILVEKLKNLDFTNNPAPIAFIRKLKWLKKFFAAIENVIGIIEGSVAAVFASIAGTWNSELLIAEKAKSILTGNPPRYDKILTKSIQKFEERESKRYARQQFRRSLLTPKTATDFKSILPGSNQDQGINENYDSYNINDFLAEELDISSVIDTGRGFVNNFKRDLNDDLDDLTLIFNKISDKDADASTIASGLQALGLNVDEEDFNFVEIMAQADPDMPLEVRIEAAEKLLEVFKGAIFPAYFASLLSTVLGMFKDVVKELPGDERELFNIVADLITVSKTKIDF